VQPIGKSVSDIELEVVESALAAFYDATVQVLPRIAMPPESFVGARRRYQAEVLLDYLARQIPRDGCRILGVTSDDICSEKDGIPDWGVVGLASSEERSSVVSSFRCGHNPTGRVRLAKVAVHEMAHTFGLFHCSTPGCLMQDAAGKVGTVDGEYDMCPRCRALLQQVGYPVPPHPRIPWGRPVHASRVGPEPARRDAPPDNSWPAARLLRPRRLLRRRSGRGPCRCVQRLLVPGKRWRD
jgi:archaemetzincin